MEQQCRKFRILVYNMLDFDIHKSFDEGILHSVYDLVNDKEELHNLKDKIDTKLIKKELEILKKEFSALKKDVEKNNFINNY